MNADFIKLIHTIKKTHGSEILTNARKLRSFLADYAAGKYPGERRIFMLALEEGRKKHAAVRRSAWNRPKEVTDER